MISDTDDATTASLGELVLMVDYFIDMEPVPEDRPPWFAPPAPPVWMIAPGQKAAAQLPTARPRRVQCRGMKPNYMERGKG